VTWPTPIRDIASGWRTRERRMPSQAHTSGVVTPRRRDLPDELVHVDLGPVGPSGPSGQTSTLQAALI